jgi:hypothetical protein
LKMENAGVAVRFRALRPGCFHDTSQPGKTSRATS